MQVRRKTPILEARQFTAESALDLIADGWLKGVDVVGGAPVGLVTRSASRSAAVPLDGWIVLERVQDSTVVQTDDTGTILKTIDSEPIKAYRPLSAEQFSQDFEVVDDTAKRADWNGTHDIHGVVDVLVPEGFEVVPPEEMDAMVKASKAARATQG